ncbi:unnamed protein product [Closterium sp. Yama58-4]|nr:unnamed protein product [Closterium sp. Yama58-4]
MNVSWGMLSLCAFIIVVCGLSGASADATEATALVKQINHPFLSTFSRIFAEFLRADEDLLSEPSTLLVPSNIGFEQIKWDDFTEDQQKRIFRHHILAGRWTLTDLLNAQPGTNFTTRDGGRLVTKVKKDQECYFQTYPPMKIPSPLNIPAAASTGKLIAHGVTFVFLPPNFLACPASEAICDK